jgi:hypothetical protein
MRNYISIILVILTLSGCSEKIDTYRTIEEVEIDATSSSGNKLILANIADLGTDYFDIVSKSIYHWDLPESYNIQLGSKDEDGKFCMLFNGFKKASDPEKKTVFIECIEEPIFDLHPRYGTNILNIDLNELVEETMETYPNEEIKGVLTAISGKAKAKALDNTLPIVRGASILTFESDSLVSFNDLESILLDRLKITLNDLYAESEVKSETTLTVDDIEVINIELKIKTPFGLGTVTFVNILTEAIFDVYKITLPKKQLSENFWDIKTGEFYILISVKKPDPLYQKYLTDIRVGVPDFEKFISSLKEEIKIPTE